MTLYTYYINLLLVHIHEKTLTKGEEFNNICRLLKTPNKRGPQTGVNVLKIH